MRLFNTVLLVLAVLTVSLFTSVSLADDEDKEQEIYLGINTADVKEDTSSVQFLNLFRSALPFNETVPWGSSKEVSFDKYGWPNNLNGGKAGTKFLNRLPEGTVEDGFFTVLYDGEGEIFYGNDARLVVHRPNKDIIEIRAGKDSILNASLFIKQSNPDNYVRNIRILPEGGICKGAPEFRVKSPADCAESEYLSFEEHHFNPWAKEQREAQAEEKRIIEEASEKTAKTASDKSEAENTKSVDETKTNKDSEKIADADKEVTIENKTRTEAAKKEANDNLEGESKQVMTEEEEAVENDAILAEAESETVQKETSEPQTSFIVKGSSELKTALIFNPEYFNFMKDFQMIRYMNMSGMTRNPVVKWRNRNTLKKATWGGKYGSRGAPVEIMVELSNRTKSYPWFSMPYKANNKYIKSFGEYVNEHLNPELKSYIEYSNEVWNPIFIHREYAIKQGVKQKLDKKDVEAGYKWFSKRSVQTFKIWEKAFGGTDRLIRVMGGWASNQVLSGKLLKYKDAYKHTDAIAIGPYFSALPRVLRRAETVDDVFKFMLDKKTKWGMDSTINYIKKQAKVAKSYGVDLVAYEGGQHLVDWNTRKVNEHPNPLLYAANRDPRMGILYDELMNEWHRAGGKLFVAFSAPRIYSWYGSWGIKEHIRQPRSDAPKYDSLLRYLNTRLYPENLPQPGINEADIDSMSGTVKNIKSTYAKTPLKVWDMSNPQHITSPLKDVNTRDIDAHWQANWDTKNLYLSVAVNDDSIHQGDEVKITFDTTTVEEVLAKEKEQEKRDIENEKVLLEKKKKAKAARKLKYERIAKEKKEKELALKKAKEALEKGDNTNKTSEGSKSSETKTAMSTGVDNNEKEAKKSDIVKVIEKKEETITVDDKKNVDETKKAETKLEKTEDKTEQKEELTTVKNLKNKVDAIAESKNKVDSETKDNDENKTENEEANQSGLQKYFDGNVITFTFTPFDDLNNYSRFTASDLGYIINVAIPWSEIYYKANAKDIQMKSGDRLGINIVIQDYDKDDKGNKSLMSADTSLPLPKLILKNILVE